MAVTTKQFKYVVLPPPVGDADSDYFNMFEAHFYGTPRAEFEDADIEAATAAFDTGAGRSAAARAI